MVVGENSMAGACSMGPCSSVPVPVAMQQVVSSNNPRRRPLRAACTSHMSYIYEYTHVSTYTSSVCTVWSTFRAFSLREVLSGQLPHTRCGHCLCVSNTPYMRVRTSTSCVYLSGVVYIPCSQPDVYLRTVIVTELENTFEQRRRSVATSARCKPTARAVQYRSCFASVCWASKANGAWAQLR